MNKTKVAVVRCDTYSDDKVSKAIETGLNLLGGVSVFAKPGERIVMKPNVLIGTNAEKCVTTHPAVFKAVGIILKNAGASVYYGDSPSFGKCETNLRKAGLKQIGDELGFTLANFDSGRLVSHKDSLLVFLTYIEWH